MGGASVVAAPGEDIQQAVLNHLQRLAISIGAPIRATIHDDRAGCVVPLEVSADGSSRVTGTAVRVAPREGVPSREGAQAVPPVRRPEPVPAGTVQAPTGQFGPPPVMSAGQAPAPVIEVTEPEPIPVASVPKASAPKASVLTAMLEGEPDLTASAAGPTPTPARGFDAVAEEVLGDGPVTETAEGAELLTEPMARINEAVRAGRIEAAAELTDRTVTEATTVLGPGHAEVLHLRELSAYIAYLGGEPVRAFRQSLDLARLRRQARDAEAAYGNVRSAATAWRAVRDPEEGLRLGRDLIELWTDLTQEPGPAADDPGPLESARARMVRLSDRAARAAQA
ncbi:hypothetical protein BFF78_17915 [Streptomyces fodineus]|uniref:Uncharacterized protein n=1 Tax=Streptomyces fodineus TaxID=1904616 RepID=A0A1D7YNI8_9ACTN|nr:hypothetical protein BFF78_17915 [Streptomyces fodineus]